MKIFMFLFLLTPTPNCLRNYDKMAQEIQVKNKVETEMSKKEEREPELIAIPARPKVERTIVYSVKRKISRADFRIDVCYRATVGKAGVVRMYPLK